MVCVDKSRLCCNSSMPNKVRRIVNSNYWNWCWFRRVVSLTIRKKNDSDIWRKIIKNPNLGSERSVVRLEVAVGLLVVFREVGLKSWRKQNTVFPCFDVFVSSIEFQLSEFVLQVWYWGTWHWISDASYLTQLRDFVSAVFLGFFEDLRERLECWGVFVVFVIGVVAIYNTKRKRFSHHGKKINLTILDDLEQVSSVRQHGPTYRKENRCQVWPWPWEASVEFWSTRGMSDDIEVMAFIDIPLALLDWSFTQKWKFWVDCMKLFQDVRSAQIKLARH